MAPQPQQRPQQRMEALDGLRALSILVLPPFAAACGGIAVAGGLGLLQWHWPSFLGALTFTKNTLLLQGDWFFGHFWILSLEEQFYLVWPLLVLVLLRGQHALLALAGLTLASPLLTLLSQAAYPLFDNTLPCLPYLALGCLMALLLHERHPALQ